MSVCVCVCVCVRSCVRMFESVCVSHRKCPFCYYKSRSSHNPTNTVI